MCTQFILLLTQLDLDKSIKLADVKAIAFFQELFHFSLLMVFNVTCQSNFTQQFGYENVTKISNFSLLNEFLDLPATDLGIITTVYTVQCTAKPQRVNCPVSYFGTPSVYIYIYILWYLYE